MSTITLNPKAKPDKPKSKPSKETTNEFLDSSFWKSIRQVLPNDMKTSVGLKLLDLWSNEGVEWLHREADNLMDAFLWSSTPQGDFYWQKLHVHLKEINHVYAERCS